MYLQNRVYFVIVFAAVFFAGARCKSVHAEDSAVPGIAANTNQHAAGVLTGGELTVELEIREGTLYPEDESGPHIQVYAFGERGKQLQVPGPMIRVPQDTRIHVTIHNLIVRDVQIHGMHSRPGKDEDTFMVTSGATRDVTFTTGAPGAYYYWATAGGDTVGGRPYKEDSQLHGAFIVDPPGTVAPDRVFIIGTWRDRQLPQESFDVPMINGKSWPYTERLEYPVGSEVRWVWLNPSGLVHPMHIHGSYFRVVRVGDAEHNDPVPPSRIREVTTNFMAIGGTMTTLWKPARTGRWLFHCHILTHMSPETSAFHHMEMHHGVRQTDPLKHMAGLVMGITILPRNGAPVAHEPPKAERKLQMLIVKDKSNPKKLSYSVLESGHATQTGGGPGPTLVLTRNQTVAIHITNQLDEPTSVHWHGIELESYYDGVPGWGGDGPKVSPMIMPGKSFDAVFSPPRAGTFIYHTHMNDMAQLSSGLYGALIVVPEGTTFRPESDKVFLLSRNGKRKDGELLLNGSTTPAPLELRVGVQYRLRFIDILANNSIVINAVQEGKPIQWIPVAKDGADLASVQSVATPASFTIAPGETYDFAFTPEKSGKIDFIYDQSLLDEHVRQVATVTGEVQR
ncbi:MAG: multicopper oxidase domain-containing protein [Acidobacteriaceae bacterium]|nr:multicopper oxidase domain-containing protein [Acidobacteriaceae bacterium]